MFDFKCPDSDSPIRKRTHWRGSYKFGPKVNRVCDRNHAKGHKWCRGTLKSGQRLSDHAKQYPSKLCRAIVRDFKEGLYTKVPGKDLSNPTSSGRHARPRTASHARGEKLRSQQKAPRSKSRVEEYYIGSEVESEPSTVHESEESTDEESKEILHLLRIFAGGLDGQLHDNTRKATTCRKCTHPKEKGEHKDDDGCKKYRRKLVEKQGRDRRKQEQKLATSTGGMIAPPGLTTEGPRLRRRLTTVEAQRLKKLAEERLGLKAEIDEEVKAEPKDNGAGPFADGEPKPEVKKEKITLEDLLEIPDDLVKGSLLRELQRGGSNAAKAVLDLHRRWFHLPASQLELMLLRANLPEELIKEVPEILKKCGACKPWAKLPPKQVARADLARDCNETVWFDLLFITANCEGEARNLVILQMIDEASGFQLFAVLPNKSGPSIRAGMQYWFSIFGFPKNLKGDQESGLRSDENRDYFAINDTKLLLLPKAEG